MWNAPSDRDYYGQSGCSDRELEIELAEEQQFEAWEGDDEWAGEIPDMETVLEDVCMCALCQPQYLPARMPMVLEALPLYVTGNLFAEVA
jgi:hypothetical protein